MTDAPDFETIHASSRHRTRSRYKHGCRCDDCRAANTTYQRQRRATQRTLHAAADAETNRDRWPVPIVGIAIGLAAVWAVIRKAAAN